MAFSDDDASNLTARAAERVDLTAPGSISVFVLGAVAIMLVLVVLSMGESAPGAEGRVRALIRGDRLDDLYVRARLKALGAPGVEDEAYLRSLNHRKADLLTTRPFAEGALVAFSAKVGRSFPPTNFHARVQSCEPLPGDEPWHLLKLRIEHDAADSAQVDELLHELAHACSNRNSSY